MVLAMMTIVVNSVMLLHVHVNVTKTKRCGTVWPDYISKMSQSIVPLGFFLLSRVCKHFERDTAATLCPPQCLHGFMYSAAWCFPKFRPAAHRPERERSVLKYDDTIATNEPATVPWCVLFCLRGIELLSNAQCCCWLDVYLCFDICESVTTVWE